MKDKLGINEEACKKCEGLRELIDPEYRKDADGTRLDIAPGINEKDYYPSNINNG